MPCHCHYHVLWDDMMMTAEKQGPAGRTVQGEVVRTPARYKITIL